MRILQRLALKFGNSELDETIRIDTEKGTETFHITSGALDTSTGAADVVYDFKQVSIARQYFFFFGSKGLHPEKGKKVICKIVKKD